MYMTNRDKINSFFSTLARLHALGDKVPAVAFREVVFAEAKPIDEFKEALDEVYPKQEVTAEPIPGAPSVYKVEGHVAGATPPLVSTGWKTLVDPPVIAEYPEVEPAPVAHLSEVADLSEEARKAAEEEILF